MSRRSRQKCLCGAIAAAALGSLNGFLDEGCQLQATDISVSTNRGQYLNCNVQNCFRDWDIQNVHFFIWGLFISGAQPYHGLEQSMQSELKTYWKSRTGSEEGK